MKELINIQQSLVAKKDKHNKFGGYDYRSAEGILESLKKHLKENNCFLLLSDHVEERGARFYVVATATLTNSEGVSVSVTAEAREEDTKKGMDAAQITGSASSYARKYALCGLFAIDDGVDPDLTNKHGKETSAPQPTLQQALEEARKCKTKNELEESWNRNPTLHSNSEYCKEITSLKNQILNK
jgi:hypothetical protein